MSSPADTAALKRLWDTAQDDRTANVRYRQDQLRKLHAALRHEAGGLAAALAADTLWAAAEVEAELYLALEAVRHFYDGLDFERELEREYSVVRGRDGADRRAGFGVVAIRPDPAAPSKLYSVVCPLAGAIAAGNCVAVELPDTRLQLDAVLRTLLPGALDTSTFRVVEAVVSEGAVAGPGLLLVDQAPRQPRRQDIEAHRFLESAPLERTVAIVDRTADVELAARVITTARFSFGGSSPYAPDLVVVNEFVKAAFFEACSRHATRLFASESAATRQPGTDPAGREDETRRAVCAAEAAGQASAFGSSSFQLVDVLDRDAPLVRMKIRGRFLPIVASHSLNDAAFYVADSVKQLPLLAGYFFADARAAKFMAELLPCRVALINQLPACLLVGPAAPLPAGSVANFAAGPHRYTADMFTLPRPQLVEPPPEALRRVDDLLSGREGDKKDKHVSPSALRSAALAPLRPTGQPANPVSFEFFETGLFIGLGLTMSVLVPAVGFAVWKGVRLALSLRR